MVGAEFDGARVMRVCEWWVCIHFIHTVHRVLNGVDGM